MDSGYHRRFNAQERSYLAVLKKDVHALAADAGYSQVQIADIDIVVAEMTSNLIKHAKDGELLVRADEHCVELISIDQGPGMSNVRVMAQDGMSTANTLGQGLGAIKRLSDDADIYSLKGWGTITLARFYKEKGTLRHKKQAADVRYLVVPKPGEAVCGDGLAISHSAQYLKIMLGDGLGHGPEAQAVISKAERAFCIAVQEENSPVAILRSVHEGVKRSRGLVATVAVFDFAAQSWRICGVGNISGWVGNQQYNRGVMSYNGIVGVNMPGTLNEHKLPHEYGQLLILCSDGIRARWDLQKYPSILKHDLSILAAAIYKDFARQTDDMSILIARIHYQP